MLVDDLEVAKMLKSSFFLDVPEQTIKRRVRDLIKQAEIEPVYKTPKVWLYNETDIFKIMDLKCPLKPQKEKARPTTRSRVPLRDMGAFEKAQALIQNGKPKH